MAEGAGREGPAAPGSTLCPSAGPSQCQCPHMTFTLALTGSLTQCLVRKPTSSQLSQRLLPKTEACQSSQDTTRDFPYVACIKHLESNCHARGQLPLQ